MPTARPWCWSPTTPKSLPAHNARSACATEGSSMIQRLELFAMLMLAVTPLHATVFSGEVRVADAQDIFTPPSLSSPVVLRYYIADGATVKKGDILLRIDAGPAETQLRTLQAQLEQMQAKNAKEIADLELKQADAELALADAQAERDTAAVDAVIPKALISALNYDRHQGEMKRTEQALALKKQEVAQAIAAVARRREDSDLELRKQHVSEPRALRGRLQQLARYQGRRSGGRGPRFHRAWLGARARSPGPARGPAGAAAFRCAAGR